ncbi:hypothetical protein MMC13_006305 [Lambiella insularis]|nr:hypothetical protein [Lambiella insularis]
MPLTLALLFYTAQSALGLMHGRDINAPYQECYDYIVCGCGISGLVVANRLSEDPDVQVLCIEAGEADHYEAIVEVPVFVGADIGGVYDWDLSTVPQMQLDGAARPMPQGKALGGGSILNAMCWNRGGQDDYDAWEALGNPGWNWDGLLPYFMKSETYTPPYSDAIAEEYSINYNPAVHGFSGPVQVSYPKYFYPQSINFFDALNYLGVPTEFDQAEGITAGAAFVPTDINPTNQTRADARVSYYDPYSTRDNFHVMTGQHVTRLIIEGITDTASTGNPTYGGDSDGEGTATGNTGGLNFGPGDEPPTYSAGAKFVRQSSYSSNLRIVGVEFAPNATAPRQTVCATREVIVAAGSLHSTQLMELSGIGPAGLLEQLNITVALNLPGVGNNLQDHCLVGTFYPYNNNSYPSPSELTTNATYNAESEAEYYSDKTGPWTAGSPNALAFPPLPLISNNSVAILSNASSQGATDYLLPGLDSTVVAGFQAQKDSLVRRLGTTTSAAYEIINNNAGSLTVSVMHPLSRGVCWINSPDPFEPPMIDPRWLSNPTDRAVLLEALKFNRQILATPSMLLLEAAQFVPPVDADNDALNQVINNGIRTEFHPSGTLAMLPLEMGGVVDSQLLVYGTENLRVVDASIFPLVPAAHLQAVVYAVAEKAADIIKAAAVVPVPSSIIQASAAQSTIPASTKVINPSTINFGISFTQSSIPSSMTLASSNPPVPSPSATTETDSAISGQFSSIPENNSTALILQVSTTETINFSSLSSPSPDTTPYASSLLSDSTVSTTPSSVSLDTADSSFIASVSSSIVAVLTSAGVPPPLATSFESAITATLSPTQAVSSSISNPLAGLPASEQSIIDAFIAWLMSFFHLGG